MTESEFWEAAYLVALLRGETPGSALAIAKAASGCHINYCPLDKPEDPEAA